MNYDGRIGMKDLVALDAGVRNSSGSISHDVDANYDGKLNMEDLSIIDADWGSSLHFSLGDKQFLGSDQISMDELLSQGERRWNSSNFVYQNSLERDETMGEHELEFVPDMDDQMQLVTPISGIEDPVKSYFDEQSHIEQV